MKNIILIFALIGLGFSSLGQVSFGQDSASAVMDEIHAMTRGDKPYSEKMGEIKSKISSKSDFSTALIYFEEGIILAKANDNKKDEAILYILFGPFYREVGMYDKAIEFYLKADKILKLEKDSDNEKHNLFLKMSEVFLYKGDLEKALDYANYSLKIANKLNDNNKKHESHFFTANIYLQLKELDSAIVNYEKCIDILKHTKDKSSYAEVLNNLGLVYQEKGNFKEAEKNFIKSYEIAKSIDYFLLTAYIENELGDLYRLMGQYEKSKYYFDLSMSKEKEAGYIILTQSLYQNMSSLYKEVGKYDSSLFYFEKFHFITDSINKINNDNNILEVETKFRTQEKESEIVMLNKENEMKKGQIKNKNTIIYLSTISIILAVIFLIYMIRSKSKQVKTNKILSTKNIEIEHQKKEITDSINYAKIIQDSIFGKKEAVKDLYDNAAILFKPKDIVSGDFYWFNKENDILTFSVADCTGHGVPGAMMSMIGNNALNESVRVKGMKKPSDILKHLSDFVKASFSDNKTKNGMDIALCSLDLNTKKLEYSGALNSLIIVKNNGELLEVKADKNYIGQEGSVYSNHSIQLEEGDSIYIMSDGYCDQFGGEDGKKFKTSRFKAMIQGIASMSAEEQGNLIDGEFESWKGTNEQVDDVCVFVVKI
ncbi:MAG: tetratricopeptide repeat protein [Nanoarchaeota archaeon]